MGIRSHFRGAVLAQMSSGTYCIIRPLGLVKGGKGLKHHENLLTLNARGFLAKAAHVIRSSFGRGERKYAPVSLRSLDRRG